MTLGDVLGVGTGRRSETRVTLTESRPTTDSARTQPSTRQRACPRAAALRRFHVRGLAAPAPHGSDSCRPPLVPCASRHSPTYRLVYRTCRNEYIARAPDRVAVHGYET